MKKITGENDTLRTERERLLLFGNIVLPSIKYLIHQPPTAESAQAPPGSSIIKVLIITLVIWTSADRTSVHSRIVCRHVAAMGARPRPLAPARARGVVDSVAAVRLQNEYSAPTTPPGRHELKKMPQLVTRSAL
ncbi:hypothetical protein EVAR_30095_1 [Eumeta japonica]|uniref:Uncharacterized protein n=1 Tax=Eumeta variegata TaxID=151549 RepID=A0A4C1X7Q2_EUMVA|nr:hypothetical protein EVAR_30095_1 [Eumeta japonica]